MYTIEFTTILPLLREFRRSGVLRTEIPAGLGRLKQPCFVMIELLRGEMLTCYVKDSKGQTLLSQEEAQQALAAAGKLNWTFDALPEHELQNKFSRSGNSFEGVQTSPLTTGPLSTPPSFPIAPETGGLFYRPQRVPRRLLTLNQAEISSWPRKYRQVYVLVDGVRSVDKIAAMLSASPLIIEDVLKEMQNIGAILLGD